GALQAAGYETVLVSDQDGLRRELAGADALVVDLTTDPAERIHQVSEVAQGGVRTLAFYSHVEADVRTQAEEAGFDVVIPRSRMACEGATVLARLLET